MKDFWQKIEKKHYLIFFGVSLALFGLYFYIYTSVLGWELPKTVLLRKENAKLRYEAASLNRELGRYSDRLSDLEIRDEDIYRSIFGLNSIPESVREEGLKGQRRYDFLRQNDVSGITYNLRRRSDIVEKKAYVQSRSFDEIELLLRHADDMATSMPAICPLIPDARKVKISSPFGRRADPIRGYTSFHNGVDFSTKPGNPVFATGDAVVESVKIEMGGYGRQVVLNHGFGYKTRYAHLKNIFVSEGMKVRRGEKIATSGNTGRSTGPHLHYEVYYRGKLVNPYHYFDRDISVQQYVSMLNKSGVRPDDFYVHPSHRRKSSDK